MTSLRVIAFAPLAPSALLLTGCAAGGASAPEKAEAVATAEAEVAEAAGQTNQEACDVMQVGMEELAAFNSPETMSALSADPAAGVALIDAAEAAIVDAAAQVTNAEVLPAATDAAAATTVYFDFVRTMAADPANADVAGFGAQVESFMGGITGLTTACAA